MDEAYFGAIPGVALDIKMKLGTATGQGHKKQAIIFFLLAQNKLYGNLGCWGLMSPNNYYIQLFSRIAEN